MKNKNIFKLLLILFASNLIVYAHGVQVVNNANENKIIESSKAVLSKVKDVSFEFKQFSGDEGDINLDDVLNGFVSYLSPDKLVIRQKKGVLEQIFYCNSKLLIVYTPSQKQAITDKLSNWSKNSLLPLDLFSMNKFWGVLKKEFVLISVNSQNDNTCLVTFESKINKKYFLDVVIDSTSFLPVVIKVRNDFMVQSTKLSNFKINNGISKNIFSFVPDKSVEVIDLAE